MKKIILSIAFLFSITPFFAQKAGKISIEKKLSPITKDKSKYTGLSFSTKDGKGGYFIGRKYSKGYYIDHYDANMKLVKAFNMKIKSNLFNMGSIDNAFVANDNLVLIEYIKDGSKKEVGYDALISPINKFKFKRKKLVREHKKSKLLGFTSMNAFKNVTPASGVTFSENKNFFVLMLPMDVKKVEKYKFITFNNQLEKINSTVFQTKVKSRNYRFQNIDVNDSNGTIYLLGKSKIQGKKKRKSGSKYKYELIKINEEGKKKLSFNTKGKYIGSLNAVIHNNHLSCIGFYSEKGDNRYKGLVYFAIDEPMMKITDTQFSPFSEQFILDKYGKKKKKELSSIQLRNIYFTDENEIIVTAEEVFESSSMSMGNNGSPGRTREYLNLNDIICAKLDESGKALWFRNINKRQSYTTGSSGPGLSISIWQEKDPAIYAPWGSFQSTYVNGKLYIVFNAYDKIKKLRRGEGRIEFRQGASLYVIEVDEDGNYKYDKILSKKEAKVPFMVARSIVSDDGKDIIITGRKRRNKRTIRLRIK